MLRLPVVGVLGNHDYHSGQQDEVKRVFTESGLLFNQGTGYEINGVGFAGVKGFATGFGSLLVLTSITRIALSGENPVGMVMVTETAPTKWRATALGGLVGGYPLGYLLCTLTALVVLPLWGWRALYWVGILPALLVLWVRIGVKESPRFEHVTAEMLKQGLKTQLNVFAPFKRYPREMTVGALIYFFYLFSIQISNCN